MNQILERMRISQRLMLITASFLGPLAVMAFLVVKTVNKDIAFARQELMGVAYQQSLTALLEGLGSRTIALTRGDTAEAGRQAGRIDAAFVALASAQAHYGEALQFTPAGLAERKRDHVMPSAVQAEWTTLKNSPAGAAAIDGSLHLIADVRTMITHVGDTSNLILDPDLDSYYTMDAVLLALPQTQDRLVQVVRAAHQDADRQAGDRQQAFAVFAAMLKESDGDRIAADVQTALNEDKNFHGVEPQLEPTVSPALRAYTEANDTLLKALGEAPGRPDAGTAIATAAARAREASAALSAAGSTALVALLDGRLQELTNERLLDLALSGIAVSIALLVVFVTSRSINGPLASTTFALHTGAEALLAASSQVSSSAQSLSQGATEQAASLEETSASMEQMASMTRKNAENAHEAARLAGDVHEQVDQSQAALSAMVSSMGAIQESSRKVSKIIKTIDEIAFQTNILALNAAVEAARAGEAGMGFAVVADEVRNLAQRSAQAARSTADLIEESIARADSGGQQVRQVEQAIGGITSGVSRVKGLVDEVSEASRQQAQGLDQVSQAITQMEKVTQMTAATAEESAASSEELNAQAQTSMTLVEGLERLVGSRRQPTAAATPVRSLGGQLLSWRQKPAAPASAPAHDDAMWSLDATGTDGHF